MQNWDDIAIWRNFPQIWQDIFHLNHLSMFHEIYPYNGNPSISRKIQILIWRQNHQNKTRQSNVWYRIIPYYVLAIQSIL